jgi:hypothetical protein
MVGFANIAMKDGKRTPLPKPKKAKTITQLKKELWKLCRELVIARDGNTCYTCGARDLEGSNRQVGHFITSSICSTELRFDISNLRVQDYRCNINLSGNWPAFEAHLIRDHGQAYVDELKRRNRETKGKSYGSSWIIAKTEEYRALRAGNVPNLEGVIS